MSKNNLHKQHGSDELASWAVIIICFIVFWPLGLGLLIRKINSMSKAGASGCTQNQGQQQETYSRAKENSEATYQQHAAPRQPYTVQQPTPRPQPTSNQAPYAQPQHQRPQQNHPPYSAQYGTQTPMGTTTPPQHDGARPQPQATSQRPAQAAPHATATQTAGHKKKKPASDLLLAMTVLTIVLGLIGIVFLTMGASALALTGFTVTSLGLTIFGGFSFLGGLIALLVRGTISRRMKRFTKYTAIIGGRDSVLLTDLSRSVGEPVRKTRRTLEAFLTSGLFGSEAYIDSGLDRLFLSRAAAERLHREQISQQQKDAARAHPPVDNEYVAIVSELHTLYAQTADPAIGQKIMKLEELTVKIFRIVEEKPEKQPQLRRFMNYYLPTTLKLLHSYQTLERQGIAGENITAAKQDIERVLDTLAQGYEQQLDHLFKPDKLDISADIDVLENLMAQDGLTDSGNIMKTSGGH